MTKQELFEKLRNNDPLDHTLFAPILMHFAARHNGSTYGEFASNHKALVDANLKALEDFDMDMVSLISDPYRETAAFGAEIEFLPEDVPRCKNNVVQDNDDIRKLEIPDVYSNERTLDRIKGARAYRDILKGEVPVIGWIEGPLAEACDLAGISEMMMMLMMDPDAANQLMDKCTAMAKSFAKAQIEAGCNIIGMGDAVCSQVDTDTYNTFILERHKEIIEYIHQLGGLVKLHICGNINHLLPSIREIQTDLIDIDWQVDLDHAHEVLGPEVILCGNINPVIIQDKAAEEVYQISRELVENQKGKKFILSGGCEITVNTPRENLLAMRRASKKQ
jgi:MtaA/CmuA family methyltransferase